MTTIQSTTLPNGLRIVTDTVPTIETVSVGIWVGVGTRFEDMRYNGVAHMVEHMLFKGTKKRTALEIAEVIEDVGGSMNAYTSRELTSYYIHLLKEDLALGLDVLSDMILNSTLPDEEIEREREVILQEIGMCTDTPDDLVFDNYYETAYKGQALGAPILGTSEIISNMQRSTLTGYIKQHYVPAQMVVCAAGNLKHENVVKLAEKFFGHIPAGTAEKSHSAKYTGGESRLEKDLEQSHIVLGFRGIPRIEDDHYAAHTLAVLMGGGMSSRLFQEIREKRGLVYSIYSYHSAYTDDGQFIIYAGTGPDKLPELVPVVCDEIRKLAGSVDGPELKRAKMQLRAGILMGQESMSTRADTCAKSLLLNGKLRNIKEIMEKIEAVDTEAIDRVARRIFGSAPTLAALGPLEHLEPLDKIKSRLS
ncbi:MAG: insulinase family protein [Alphaproteobacteria bacterium]|nr:insulinase family protein [Alphaproteobacteria bacterium]MCB9974977.1 insulinase family protein [Rhodospirillales bacterium]